MPPVCGGELVIAARLNLSGLRFAIPFLIVWGIKRILRNDSEAD